MVYMSMWWCGGVHVGMVVYMSMWWYGGVHVDVVVWWCTCRYGGVHVDVVVWWCTCLYGGVHVHKRGIKHHHLSFYMAGGVHVGIMVYMSV